MENQEKKRLRVDGDGEPYAICPKCDEHIYYVEAEHTTTDKLYPTDQDNLNWDQDNWDNLQDSYRFLCPACHREIAEDEGEVLELFLEPVTAEHEAEPLPYWEDTPMK